MEGYAFLKQEHHHTHANAHYSMPAAFESRSIVAGEFNS